MMGSWGVCIRYFLAAVIYSLLMDSITSVMDLLYLLLSQNIHNHRIIYLIIQFFWSTTYQEVGNTHKTLLARYPIVVIESATA